MYMYADLHRLWFVYYKNTHVRMRYFSLLFYSLSWRSTLPFTQQCHQHSYLRCIVPEQNCPKKKQWTTQ